MEGLRNSGAFTLRVKTEETRDGREGRTSARLRPLIVSLTLDDPLHMPPAVLLLPSLGLLLNLSFAVFCFGSVRAGGTSAVCPATAICNGLLDSAL